MSSLIINPYSFATAGGPSLVLNDTFSGEGSEVDITLHVGETGATWTYHPSDLIANVTVNSAGMAFSDGSDGAAYASGTPPSADYTVEGNAVFIGASNASKTAITGRMDVSTSDWYMVEYDSATDVVRLAKNVSGTLSTLGSTSAYTATVNDTLDLKLVMTGTTIVGSFQVNGGGYTQIASVTDSSHTTAKKVGMFFGGASSGGVGMRLTRIFAY